VYGVCVLSREILKLYGPDHMHTVLAYLTYLFVGGTRI